jgi:hypothetical protein
VEYGDVLKGEVGSIVSVFAVEYYRKTDGEGDVRQFVVKEE